MKILKKYDHQSIVYRCFIRIKILFIPLYKEHISRNKGYGRARGTMNLGISGIGAVGEGRYTHGKGGFQQQVRLRGGDRLASGRVELVRRGRWGSVCDGNWTIESANVVCREMGFGSAFQSTTKSTEGANKLIRHNYPMFNQKVIFTQKRTFRVNLYSLFFHVRPWPQPPLDISSSMRRHRKINFRLPAQKRELVPRPTRRPRHIRLRMFSRHRGCGNLPYT